MTTFKMLSWKYKLFIVLLIPVTCLITLTYIFGNMAPTWKDPDFDQVIVHEKAGLAELSKKEIIILHWTHFWYVDKPVIHLDPDQCAILKTGTTQQSPVSQVFNRPCRITFDQRYLSGSHALVFHSPDLYIRNNLPVNSRSQNQIWVWFQIESPPHTDLNLKEYPNVFNWTMSHRRDSDVYFPYGSIFTRNITNSLAVSPKQNPPNRPLDRKSLKIKSGLAAWIVSSCETPSKREDFVKELKKYMPIHTYGECGEKKCLEHQGKGYFRCYDYIQSKYKFYLSLENSLCVDYITEKFFAILQTNMVPVVYGGGIDDQFDYSAIAPKNSFIDARRFKSPKSLASYLFYLDKNDDEYLKFFEWKENYQVITWEMGLGWCNLCQRVYEHIESKEGPLWNKWISDLDKWWNYTSENFPGSRKAKFPLASQAKYPFSPVGQSLTYKLGLWNPKPTCVQHVGNFVSYGNGDTT